MDRTDIQILTCLQENARMNASTIAERVNLSTSAVIERMRKMEETPIFEVQRKEKTLCLITKSNFKHNFIIRLFANFVNGGTKKVLYSRNSSGYSYFLCIDIPIRPKTYCFRVFTKT